MQENTDITQPKKSFWDPQQYAKFEKERNQPFYDLVQLIAPKKNMKIIDLGCGTGVLTKVLHELLDANQTVGIDASMEMLKNHPSSSVGCLTFQQMKIEEFRPVEMYDLIFSNSALQWVSGHRELFSRFHHFLSSQGQLAIQIPVHHEYPTHVIAKKLASEPPYDQFLQGGWQPMILSMEEYSTLLNQLGFKRQIVRTQIYPIELESVEGALEWVKGTMLNYYRERLEPDLYNRFVEEYKERLFAHLGYFQPLFFLTKRLLIWASL